jgi:hypothetical protein
MKFVGYQLHATSLKRLEKAAGRAFGYAIALEMDLLGNASGRSRISRCWCGFRRLIPLDNLHFSIDSNYLS